MSTIIHFYKYFILISFALITLLPVIFIISIFNHSFFISFTFMLILVATTQTHYVTRSEIKNWDPARPELVFMCLWKANLTFIVALINWATKAWQLVEKKKEFIGLDLIFCQPKNYCSSIGKRSHHAKMGLTKGCKFWVSPETHSIFCLLLHHKRMVSSVVVKKSNGNQDEKNS